MTEELKAFYFPHDIGASNDPKLIDLRIKFGWKAIGMFWAIIEALHKEKDGEISPSILTSLIFDFYSQEEFRDSKHIIKERKEFENYLYANALLVALPSGNITSNRVKENLLSRKEKSEKAKASAEIRWSKINKKPNKNNIKSISDANALLVALPAQCERYAIKERKGNDKNPSFTDVNEGGKNATEVAPPPFEIFTAIKKLFESERLAEKIIALFFKYIDLDVPTQQEFNRHYRANIRPATILAQYDGDPDFYDGLFEFTDRVLKSGSKPLPGINNLSSAVKQVSAYLKIIKTK